MAESKQFGLFWGNSALFMVESVETVPKRTFYIPFGESNKATIKDGPLSPGGIELISDIENALHKQKVTSPTVNLSLPTRDIIFRSFVIPWMPHHEIKSVVEFEVGKYIPFSLEELSFSFHPITITENNVKRIRVIFVGIKNTTLQNYVNILENASLNVNIIEPSASSLIRTISFKNLVPKDQTIALIEKEEVGRIIVVDNEIPQFVREFHLSTMAPEQTERNSESVMKRLGREVRISLDYFNRQNAQLRVTQLFLLSATDSQELAKNLEKELDIHVTCIEDRAVFGDIVQKEIGFLNAYGMSIISTINQALYFNFSKKEPVEAKPKEAVPKNQSITNWLSKQHSFAFL